MRIGSGVSTATGPSQVLRWARLRENSGPEGWGEFGGGRGRGGWGVRGGFGWDFGTGDIFSGILRRMWKDFCEFLFLKALKIEIFKYKCSENEI